jgi:hypothetical protein
MACWSERLTVTVTSTSAIRVWRRTRSHHAIRRRLNLQCALKLRVQTSDRVEGKQYNYRSGVAFTRPNTAADSQGGYGLMGLRTGVKSMDAKWEWSAWARNLTEAGLAAVPTWTPMGPEPMSAVGTAPRQF